VLNKQEFLNRFNTAKGYQLNEKLLTGIIRNFIHSHRMKPENADLLVDEYVAEAMAKVWAERESIPPAYIERWLKVVVRNHLTDLWEKEKQDAYGHEVASHDPIREASWEVQDETYNYNTEDAPYKQNSIPNSPGYMFDPTPNPAEQEGLSPIEEAVARLPERQRQIISLTAEGKSLREIGGELGMSPEGVRRQLEMAKGAIKALYQADESD